MRHKSIKRSIASKQQQRRRSSTSSINAMLTSSDMSTQKVDLGIGTVHLDSHAPCLKSSSINKSQKVLKRELLRCNDQRPSLLGSQTLQPPRIHHGSQQMHATNSSMSADRLQSKVRRRSLSVNSRTFYATIDRIGPWPDVSISRLRSDGNELLRPLKNFRNVKNPRVFSPKYYAAMTENTIKFKFFSQTRNYIEQYRKQKGYILDSRTDVQQIPLPLSAPQITEDERTSITGEFSLGIIDTNNGTARDRASQSTHDLSEQLSMTTPPSIPSSSKVPVEVQHSNNLPTVALRNAHLRSTRNTQQQQQHSITLPSLTASSLHYLSSINSVEKAYSNSKNKSSLHPPSKFFLVDSRHKRRLAQRIQNESEIASRSHDYSNLRATGGPVVTTSQRTTSVVIYQLPRRPQQLSLSRTDVEPLI